MSWDVAAVVAAAALLVANPVVVTRARAWLRTRRRPLREQCETCGARPRRIHELGTGFDDDDALGMGVGDAGGSFMAATYCREHAPAGAQRKANRRA
jgi:hypothetical protein